MRDVTLGQYYPIDSPIHRLDPRIKIIGALLYIVLAFVVGTYIGLALLFAFIAVITALSKVPVKSMLKGLKAVYILLAFTFIINACFSGGDTVWAQWWIFTITKEGVIRAIFMALRLVLLITGASLLTLTTSPIQLTDGIERLLSPLAKIKFPAHEIAMMMSIALRFIPTLMEETDRIMKAQAARGAVFDKGGLIARAKAIIPLLVPLFVSAFRRAGDLAMAMEARCYHGGEGRTHFHVLRFQRADFIALAVLCLFTAAAIADGALISRLLPMLARP